MKTLQDRLQWAMDHAEPPATQADLVRACKSYGEKISSAAVAKWLSTPVQFLKPAYLFAVASRCAVDAEWLALGKGKPKAKDAATAIPAARLALLQAYDELPTEVRFHIRKMIEILAVAKRESYATWSHDMDRRAKERDSKDYETEK